MGKRSESKRSDSARWLLVTAVRRGDLRMAAIIRRDLGIEIGSVPLSQGDRAAVESMSAGALRSQVDEALADEAAKPAAVVGLSELSGIAQRIAQATLRAGRRYYIVLDGVRTEVVEAKAVIA